MDNINKTTPYYKDERKIAFVVLLTFVVMSAEIVIGYFSHSMALFADGIHMGSHVLLISLNWLAYHFVYRQQKKGIMKYSPQKIMQLSAFVSGILLVMMSVFICIEGIEHMESHHHMTNFPMALGIAMVGLVVNAISAKVLHSDHFDENPNNYAAYIHVLSDMLVKLGVILGLVCSYLWDITWLDAFVAIVTAGIVLTWAFNLLRRTAKSLTMA